MVTVNPNYMMKGQSNPYYDLDSSTLNTVSNKLKKDYGVDVKNIRFKCVLDPSGKLLYGTTGKFYFELESDEKLLGLYIRLKKSNVKGHSGGKTRKNATASSDVNEILSVYYLENVSDSVESLETLASRGGKSQTGVMTGDGKGVTFDRLRILLDEDETAERDILIGQQNAKAIKKDINGKGIRSLYWTPKKKPANISSKNPSDVIIEFTDRTYQGYSNKIASGVDVTPKFNTNITAFYGKLSNARQLTAIENMIDASWNEAEENVTGTNAKNALSSFDISEEKFSESSSKGVFASLSRSFSLDQLDFYTKDFYYPFRNNLITKLAQYLENVDNLIYFLRTIYFYTYDDPNSTATPCPYKLLIGAVNGSKIKEVGKDEKLKQLLHNEDKKKIKSIKNTYDGTSQSFKVTFKYDPGTNGTFNVTIPVTARTRAAGGWSGKSLYITSSGVKIS